MSEGKNNSTWLRVSLALMTVLAGIAVGAATFSVKRTIANTERLAIVETSTLSMQRQLDRMEDKLDRVLYRTNILMEEDRK